MEPTFLVLTDKQFNQIIGRLDTLEQLLQNLNNKPAATGYLEQKEMEKATHLSRGTLLKMRKKGLLRAAKFDGGKKVYYNIEDFQRALANNELPD